MAAPTKLISVDVTALAQVLQALTGPGHLIRELQATRSLHKMGHPNPIETLLEQVDAWARADAKSAPATQAPPAFQQLEMNPDLLEILGRPCFRCIQIAQILRASGTEIQTRAENEQAAVLLFLLNHYLADNLNWYTNASEELKAKFEKSKGGAA